MQGAYYHILSRGNEGREIFYGDEDKGLFLETVGEISDRFDIDIFAFTNEEIGGFFGVGYSAVSHIVRRGHGHGVTS